VANVDISPIDDSSRFAVIIQQNVSSIEIAVEKNGSSSRNDPTTQIEHSFEPLSLGRSQQSRVIELSQRRVRFHGPRRHIEASKLIARSAEGQRPVNRKAVKRREKLCQRLRECVSLVFTEVSPTGRLTRKEPVAGKRPGELFTGTTHILRIWYRQRRQRGQLR